VQYCVTWYRFTKALEEFFIFRIIEETWKNLMYISYHIFVIHIMIKNYKHAFRTVLCKLFFSHIPLS